MAIPFLVVLDEPNSNLDAEGDAALTQAILSVRRRGGIAIVVAHRPSALEGVDMALAMVNGGVAAFGEKEEVLRKVLRPNVVPAIKPGPQVVQAAAQGQGQAPGQGQQGQPQPQKGREEAAAS